MSLYSRSNSESTNSEVIKPTLKIQVSEVSLLTLSLLNLHPESDDSFNTFKEQREQLGLLINCPEQSSEPTTDIILTDRVPCLNVFKLFWNVTTTGQDFRDAAFRCMYPGVVLFLQSECAALTLFLFPGWNLLVNDG